MSALSSSNNTAPSSAPSLLTKAAFAGMALLSAFSLYSAVKDRNEKYKLKKQLKQYKNALKEQK